MEGARTPWRVDTIVRAKVVESDEVGPVGSSREHQAGRYVRKHLRLVASLADLLIDTVSTTVDGAVLGSHDRLHRRLVLDCAHGQLKSSTQPTPLTLASESGDFGNDDHHTELGSLTASTHDTLDERLRNLVLHRAAVLRVGDEELVLYNTCERTRTQD